jgi:hypothetical protein
VKSIPARKASATAADNSRKRTATVAKTAVLSASKRSANKGLDAETRPGAQTNTPMPATRHTKIGRLDTPERVQREMARIYRRVRWREIHPQEGKILTVMLRSLLDVMVIATEQRNKAVIVRELRKRGYEVPDDFTLPMLESEPDQPPIDVQPEGEK